MNRRESLKLGASIVTGMAVTPGIYASETTTEKKPTDSFWEVVKNRRSVRKFKPDPIPEEDLLKIVDAARMAPCANNDQAWMFIIIQDKKRIEALKDECLKVHETILKKVQNLSGDALKKQLQKKEEDLLKGRLSAPAYIVVLVDSHRQFPAYNIHDGPLAAGYLLLAARALGYGTVYMTDSIPEKVTRKVFNIPERYTQVCVTPIGIPLEWPTQNKKKLDEFIVKESFFSSNTEK
jgi:nitroreductase